jgi:hypothetical protein
MRAKIKFTKEMLQYIELLGQQGKQTVYIASQLGMTSCGLQKEREKNKDLDDALKRAEFNFNKFAMAKLYELAMSGKNLTFSNEVYKRLYKENISKLQEKNRKL